MGLFSTIKAELGIGSFKRGTTLSQVVERGGKEEDLGLFYSMDTDGDGVLSREEVAAKKKSVFKMLGMALLGCTGLGLAGLIQYGIFKKVAQPIGKNILAIA